MDGHPIIINLLSLQDTNCEKEKETRLCRLYVLTDCALSITMEDNLFFGKPMHNMTVCDEFESNFTHVKEVQKDARKSEVIFNMFYQIYLTFSKVLNISKCKVF